MGVILGSALIVPAAQAQQAPAAAAPAADSAAPAGDPTQQYLALTSEADSLKLYNKQLEAQLQSQQAEMASIRKEEADLDVTNLKIQPLMQDMVAALKQFVSLDIPFMTDVRSRRVETLEQMMPQANVTVSEKYRRIVEAYNVEIGYGRTIGTYTGKVGDKDVEFLRVGRVALLYQTADGSETGYWDRDKKDWVIDNGVAGDVNYALKVAKNQTAPDLFTIPVMAASAAGEQ